jgi:cell division protein FtsI/penicillin-binding protein 2
VPAIRGVMRDKSGEVLVDCEPACTVAIDPFHRLFRQETGSLERTLARLSSIIQMDPAEMAATIEREKGRSYLPVFLKRHLDPETVAYIENIATSCPACRSEIEARRRYVQDPRRASARVCQRDQRG